MSRWPVAGPSGYWLLASSPASKVKKKKSNAKQYIRSVLNKPYLFSLTQHKFIIQTNNCKTYTYINNILYTVNTPTCFDTPLSSSGSLILLLCYSYENHSDYKLSKIILLKCSSNRYSWWWNTMWNKKPTRCHLVLYIFLLISCSTCFGPPCAHLQELTT